MRLSELIDFTARPTKRSFTDYKRRIVRGTDSTVNGQGSFGTAYDINSPKRQNEITKIARAGKLDMYSNIEHTPAEEDGYIIWLKTAHTLSEQGNANPYFPVVNNLIIHRSATKKEYYKVDLEKLTSFTAEKIVTNHYLMMSVYETIFQKNPDDTTTPEYVPEMIRFKLKHAIYNNDVSGIKDKDLIKIIPIIRQILSKHMFSLDLHTGNLMWRITNNKPHLVILDPFA